MRTAWAIAAVYTGSVIGAGFASGQEVLRFFAAFGSNGVWGMMVAGALFALFGAALLDRVYVLETSSHEALLLRLCGPYIGSLVDLLLNLFLFASIGVMLAGAGALLRDHHGLPFTVGVLATALTATLILRRDVNRLLRLNGALVVVLLVLTVVLLFPAVLIAPLPTVLPETDIALGMIPGSWFVGALLYVSFNVALAISPLGALGTQIEARWMGLVAALIGGALLSATGGLILVVLLKNLHHIAQAELPIVALLQQEFPGMAKGYSAVLYFALMTSLVAASYGLGHRAHGIVGGQGGALTSWLPFLAVPIAYVGFGKLVQTLYPIIGYVGLGIVLAAILRTILPLLPLFKGSGAK